MPHRAGYRPERNTVGHLIVNPNLSLITRTQVWSYNNVHIVTVAGMITAVILFVAGAGAAALITAGVVFAWVAATEPLVKRSGVGIYVDSLVGSPSGLGRLERLCFVDANLRTLRAGHAVHAARTLLFDIASCEPEEFDGERCDAYLELGEKICAARAEDAGISETAARFADELRHNNAFLDDTEVCTATTVACGADPDGVRRYLEGRRTIDMVWLPYNSPV